MFDFSSNSMPINFALFAGGAVAIWMAGTKLERYTDAIADVTGLGKAFLGIMLLATATSLPEVATSITATLSGNVDMAVYNLLGGVVMQTAVLGIADIASGRRALTGRAPHFALLMEGVGLIFVLGTAMVGISVVGVVQERFSSFERSVATSIWAVAILVSFLFMLLWTRSSQENPRWQPKYTREKEPPRRPSVPDMSDDQQHHSLRKLGIYFSLGSLVVLLGGWLVARTGEVLAEQTGLGATFVGFTLVAVATSLPEISTTVSASRGGNFEAAVSNIYGSNAFCVALLALVAFLGGADAMLESLSGSAGFAASLGIVVTAIYLWGLLERRDRTVWRLGWDSTAVIILALFGNVVIYILR